MLGDEPVAVVLEAAGAAGHVDPVDWFRLAQLGELFDRQPREVDVGVKEVEVGRDVGGFPLAEDMSWVRSSFNTICNVF